MTALGTIIAGPPAPAGKSRRHRNMANHPNRPDDHPSRNPTPEEVRDAREAAGLDKLQAAQLVHVSVRSWIGWEEGEQRMHPSMWELFRLKTGQLSLEPADRHPLSAVNGTAS